MKYSETQVHFLTTFSILMVPNRAAFREGDLVLTSKPQRWISHASCVWTAPAPLKQVIKLRKYYGDCKTLFCDFLGVKSANTQHVVNELCTISKGDDQVNQRFEELFTLLERYNSTKSGLNSYQIQRIRTAPVFPVNTIVGLNGEPDIVLRSMDSSLWYIPDRATLESAFRGKAELLNLPVTSVRKLKDLFKNLRCEELFLSSAVEEEVTPCGTSVRDKVREHDLEIRLKYIYQ